MVRFNYPIALTRLCRHLITSINSNVRFTNSRWLMFMVQKFPRKVSMTSALHQDILRKRRKMEAVSNGASLVTAAKDDTSHLSDMCSAANGLNSEGDDDLKDFDALFPILVEDLSRLDDAVTVDAIQWFRKVNEYNVPFGKKNRGLVAVQSYRYLSGDKCTKDGVRLAMILGWCIEWLQAFFLVADDIMDSSLTRRGQPCWYRKDNVKLIAINDSFYLESCIYSLLRKYFRQMPYYIDIVDIFHKVTMQTVTGQNLDLITAPTDHVDFTSYTSERYNAIVKYKTAFYSFYLPVACAMYMNGINDKKSHEDAQTILLKMGEYFQIQDDFLDCFGDAAVTGKVGTDIEDNKCSWLIVQALSRANPEQRAMLQANYGRHDAECVAKVKAIYTELQLQELYAEYEESSYAELMRLIEDLGSSTLPREMFVSYVNRIYKRKK